MTNAKFSTLSLPASNRVAVVDANGREVAIRTSAVSANAVAQRLNVAAKDGPESLIYAFRGMRYER